MGLKIALVKRFGWSLYDLDRTDLESLMPFIGKLMAEKGKKGKRHDGGSKSKTVFCDDPKAAFL